MDTPKKKRGGFREGAGLKASITDGNGLHKTCIMLDAYTLRVFLQVGKGNISEGARKVARYIKQMEIV